MTDTYLPDFDKARTAIVLIEFQAEWLAEDGVLYRKLVQDKNAFRQAVAQAAAVLDGARQAGWTIAHAGLDLRDDPGYRIYAGGADKLGLRAVIPKAGTWTGEGARFVPPFTPRTGEFIVRGRSGASALQGTNLDAFLRNNRLDTLLLMGFATHVCVESTLRDAHDRGFNGMVVTNACAAFASMQDEYFRQHIVHHFGAGIEAKDVLQVFAEAPMAGPE